MKCAIAGALVSPGNLILSLLHNCGRNPDTAWELLHDYLTGIESTGMQDRLQNDDGAVRMIC